MAACRQNRPPEVVEAPQKFRGWAVIAWGVVGHPLLPRDSSKLIERIPSNGVLITGSPQNFGWAADEFYILDSSGNRLPNTEEVAEHFAVTGTKGVDPHALHFTEFFVGTPADV